MPMNTTNKGTYIIIHDNMLCVKAIDLAGEKINMTSTDHLIYQKLRHMYDKLKKAGKPCYPSKHWLSCHLAVSDRTVAESLKKLRKVGLIDWKKMKRYGNVRNLYTVSSVLKQSVYVADLKCPVPFAQAQQALKERLQALCEETIETDAQVVDAPIDTISDNARAQSSNGEVDENSAYSRDTGAMAASIQGLVKCLDDGDF